MKSQDTKRFSVGSSERLVNIYGWPDARTSKKPLLLMIHGMFTGPAYLMDWAERLEDRFNVMFAALPGHAGGGAFAAPTVPALSAAFVEACALIAPGRPARVVGDSIGGTIALAMAASRTIKGVVAVEPPLQTGKLWCFHDGLPRYRAQVPIPAEVLDGLMGAGDPPLDRNYRPLLDKLAAPATVIAGDIPLQPPRTYEKTPSHLDAGDHAAIRAARRAHLQIVSGGHLLMGQPSDQVVECVRGALI